MEIRKLKVEDYKGFYNLLYKLDEETDFMLFEKGERNISEDGVEKLLSLDEEDKIVLGVVSDEGKIIGFLSGTRGEYKRIRHSVYIVIGIREGFTGKGIGKKLFEELFLWGEKFSIKRYELTVCADNLRGIKLYKKMGFNMEGIKEKSILKDGIYIDEYYMAKILN